MSSTSSSARHSSERWRLGLRGVAGVVAVEVALHSFIVKEPILTLVGAGLWLGGALWTQRGGKGGPLLIGALALFEIIATLFFSEEFAAESDLPLWVLSLHIALVSAALVAAVTTVTRERKSVEAGVEAVQGVR